MLASPLRGPRLTVSVVSHGQGQLLAPLLLQLQEASGLLPMQVIVTLNLPEAAPLIDEDDNFRLTLIVNKSPQGFAENHNAAFRHASAPFFCVINPDVRIEPESLLPLLDCVERLPGVAGPRVLAPDGDVEDSARRVPSVLRLVGRRWRRRSTPDYSTSRIIQRVDWMAGMCLVFQAQTFRDIGGFDERFHMYCEDVDICLKIHLAGGHVSWVQDSVIVHDAQRASHRNWRYLAWHITSLMRLFGSGTYWRFRLSGSAHDKKVMHV